MTADALNVPLVPDYLSRLEAHFMRELAAVVQDWSQCIGALTRWEDEHLLEKPASELLAVHRQTVERLLRFGQLLSLATTQADFPDKAVAEIVASTQACLRDKLSLWHGTKTTEAERARILQSCFNES